MVGCGLKRRALEGVDPYDPNLSTFTKRLILAECLENPHYFLTKVVRKAGMGKHYENFVKEVLATIQHQIRYPETRRPIHVRLRQQNMESFLTELRAQCTVLHPEMDGSNPGSIHEYFLRQNIHLEINYQIILNEDFNYVRYEPGNNIIFADYDQ